MSPWGWVIFATVALWLAPGSLWRFSANALLIQWFAGEWIYQVTGDRLPTALFVAGDLAVIAATVFRRSHWSDWLIVAPYPVVWWLYAMPQTREQWIALYLIALAQFVLAGPWPNMGRALHAYSHGPRRPLESTHEGA